MWSALLILGGLAGLLVEAALLVRGSTALASRLGIRPIVIGLTVVSLGTSLPEPAIGIDAARQGSPGLAVGNIVGANLVNILFILGLSALIRPITFERLTLRFDLPAMTAASLALWLLALDDSLARVDGIVLCLAGSPTPLASSGRAARSRRRFPLATRRKRSQPPLAADPDRCSTCWPWSPGSRSSSWGLSCSSTVPSRSTAGAERGDHRSHRGRDRHLRARAGHHARVHRPRRSGHRLGNLPGSSVYNIALILGITILVAPSELEIPPEVVAADLLLLAVVAVITVPVVLSGQRMTRGEGGAFVAAYVGYLLGLILG
jgi:cation:H+ antiporter